VGAWATMPIEQFEVALSSARVRSTIKKAEYTGTKVTGFIDRLREILLAAGWTETGTLCAGHVITWGFSPPITTPPAVPPIEKPIVNRPRFLHVDGADFCYFDPYRETPGACHGGGGIWVPLGPNSDETMDNTAGKVEQFSNHYADWYYQKTFPTLDGKGLNPYIAAWHLQVTHKPDQHGRCLAEYNDAVFAAHAGMIGIAGENQGGGYELQSQAVDGKSQFTVKIYEQGQSALLTLAANGGEMTFQLVHSSAASFWGTEDVEVIANPHQLAIFRTAVGNSTWWKTIFITAPKLDPRVASDIDYCVFAIEDFRSGVYWPHWLSSGSCRVALALNGPLKILGGQPSVRRCGCPVMLAELGTTPLCSSDGKPLVTSAFLMLPGPADSDPARIVGKLWDSLILSDSAAYGSEMNFQGRRYHLMSTDPGTHGSCRASWWMNFE